MTLLPQFTNEDPRHQAKKRPITSISSFPEQIEGVRGVYLHVPFCFHKCHYCDFYSIVDSRGRQEAFVERLTEELLIVSELLREPLRTIYVGGGTPTLLSPGLWETLLSTIQSTLIRGSRVEFSVEANPETVTPELATILVEGGVNRMSVGAQSFHPVHLKTLERWHDPDNVKRSVDILRQAGIRSLNLDLIFAIPGQSLEEALNDLDTALSLEPDHLSCYDLTYEPNTPMTERLRRGEFQPATQDLEADMYRGLCGRLESAGFIQYEISAWAQPDHQCQHNMLYWRNEQWWPVGPGASGHVAGFRWKNIPRLSVYLDSSGLCQVQDVEFLDEDGRIGEELMMGLRLREGIPLSRIDEMLKSGDRAEQRAAAFEKHIGNGLLARRESGLQLTEAGLLLADSILVDLI